MASQSVNRLWDVTPASREAKRLLDSGFLPIPLNAGLKRPALCHKPRDSSGPRWTRETALQEPRLFSEYKDLGILCVDGVFVVDFDTRAEYDAWHALFGPSMDAAPMTQTSKGVHVWFRRSPLAEELGVYDGALGQRVLADGTKEKIPVDIKTITRQNTEVVREDGSTFVYHTPGFLAVFPSSNKVWIRSVHDTPLLPVPDDLLQHIASLKPGGIAAASRARSGSRSAVEPKRVRRVELERGLATQPAFVFKPTFENDSHCLRYLGFDTAKISDQLYYNTINDRMRERGYLELGLFQFKYTGSCPLCSKPKCHNKGFWLAYKTNGARYLRSFSENCKPHGGDFTSAVSVPWSMAGRAAWIASLRATSRPAPQWFIDLLSLEFQHWFGPVADAFFHENGTRVCVLPKAADGNALDIWIDAQSIVEGEGHVIVSVTRFPFFPREWNSLETMKRLTISPSYFFKALN